LAHTHIFFFGTNAGHVYEIYPQLEMPAAMDPDHHVLVWIEFLKSHVYGRDSNLMTGSFLQQALMELLRLALTCQAMPFRDASTSSQLVQVSIQQIFASRHTAVGRNTGSCLHQ